MKFAALGFVMLTGLVLLTGIPWVSARPDIGHHWDSPAAILPMTFAHKDHVGQNCISCHHNYRDDTGHAACMYCHVADERVADVLEQQFHELCMGCHVEQQHAGNPHGPVRSCIECHTAEDKP